MSRPRLATTAPEPLLDALTLEHWPIERLIDYARNPRKNDHAVAQMAAVIREFGFRIPVVAKSTGELVDGHLRLKAARAIEIAPQYVDVAIRRFHNHFPDVPVTLAATGQPFDAVAQERLASAEAGA